MLTALDAYTDITRDWCAEVSPPKSLSERPF
jgi:hypothetical protein